MQFEQSEHIASALHDAWRSPRRQADGTLLPRRKTTTDTAWAAQHRTTVVDIANTSFRDLPEDWKAENRAAAAAALSILDNAGDLDGDGARRAAAAQIHQAWLKRNTWAHGGPLDVPFDLLPEDEQHKDLQHLDLVRRAAHETATAV